MHFRVFPSFKQKAQYRSTNFGSIIKQTGSDSKSLFPWSNFYFDFNVKFWGWESFKTRFGWSNVGIYLSKLIPTPKRIFKNSSQTLTYWGYFSFPFYNIIKWQKIYQLFNPNNFLIWKSKSNKTFNNVTQVLTNWDSLLKSFKTQRRQFTTFLFKSLKEISLSHWQVPFTSLGKLKMLKQLLWS